MINLYHSLLDSAVIESNYLQDVKEDINEVYEKLEKQDEIIHDTIKDVSDISSATPPDFSDVNEWKKKSVEKVKELNEDLASFTSEGNETNMQELMNQIETVMNNAKTSEGKARFADFKGASDNSELAKLMDYNENKQDEKVEKAKEARDSALGNQSESSSKDVVNKAYQEFKDGDIEYEQYIAILDSVKNTGDNLDEKTIKENADEEFIKYLKDRGMLKDYLADHKAVAEQENIKKLGDEAKTVLNGVEKLYKNGDINKEDYEELRSIVIEEGSKETKEGKGKQVLTTIMDNVIDFSEDAIPGVAGELMDMYGKLLDGKNNLHLGSKLMDRMKAVTGTLKNAGSIFSVVGGTLGYYDDVNNNDKTAGQAFSHNAANMGLSIGAGTGAASLAGLALASSGPAGWIGAGVGIGVGYAFNKAYDNNFLGLQSGLDWTGEQIDKGLDWAGDRIDDVQEQLGNAQDWAGDQLDNAVDGMRETGETVRDGVQNAADTAVDFANDVGDAVSGGLDAINPFS